MRNLQVKTLFYWFAFIVLGIFSCYWTSDSLYIWLPILGKVGSWLLAILFYVMASLSFSMILKAFDKNYDFYGKFLGRGASLLFGFLGLLLFWLICSMPTNTHTLLYSAEVRNTISEDLTTTIGYLEALENNNTAIKKINADYDSKQAQVQMLFQRMLSEMKDNLNKGMGIRFDHLLADLNVVLSGIDVNSDGKDVIQKVKNPGSTPEQWLATLSHYKAQADRILVIYRTQCDEKIAAVRKNMDSGRLHDLLSDCRTAQKDIENMDGVSNAVIEEAARDLMSAYSHISDNAIYLTFKPGDEDRYCRENALPKVKALQVIPEVWKDFLTTKRYVGHGFIWTVLISVLVDIAGFIFYYLATNKQN
ncbi:MAG: hypothetical protein K2L33_01795 [Muribaculaceae bacterium]|nr:hypothetical protein [Muribaculaceae bacterium]